MHSKLSVLSSVAHSNLALRSCDSLEFNYSQQLHFCMKSEALTPSACLCPSGLLQYSHEKGEKGGSLSFKFNLLDPEGNKLIDQSFFISVLGRVSSTLCKAGTEVFFHLVETRRQLLQIYPSVSGVVTDVMLHPAYVLNTNCVQSCYL